MDFVVSIQLFYHATCIFNLHINIRANTSRGKTAGTRRQKRKYKQKSRETSIEVSPTERPHKVVLRSGGQHGQVQVNHPSVEGHVGDEVIVDVSFHRENFTHRQKDKEAEEGGGHFTNDLRLRKQTQTFLYFSFYMKLRADFVPHVGS